MTTKPGVKLAGSPLEAVEGAEALLLATEWKEFMQQDFAAVKSAMHTPLLFDGRNLLDINLLPSNIKYYRIGKN